MGDDSNTSDPDLSGMPVTISLLVSEWRTILAHLQVGAYQMVAPIIDRIGAQAAPQLAAVQQPARPETSEGSAASESTTEARVH